METQVVEQSAAAHHAPLGAQTSLTRPSECMLVDFETYNL